MPTEQEMITLFASLSADAREVLQKLIAFVTGTGTVTWNLSGGVQVTTDTIGKIIVDFTAEMMDVRQDYEANFGGVYSSTITRDNNGATTGGTITFSSGHYLEMTYTRTAGALSSIAWTLKDSGGTTLSSGIKTITRNSSGQITSIA